MKKHKKLEDYSILDFRNIYRKFVEERKWNQFHTPRNLILALVGEVGELSEIFQWKNEVKRGIPEFTQEEKQHLGEELSDVFMYLIRIADVCNIDLSKSIIDKMKKNEIKYPVELVKGSSKKYTEYNIDEYKKEKGIKLTKK